MGRGILVYTKVKGPVKGPGWPIHGEDGYLKHLTKCHFGMILYVTNKDLI